MQNEIFRKKSLDRIQSPESLNDYVRVANPAVWLVLAAVLVLLIGTCVWGYFGRIETTLPVTVTVSEDGAFCRVEALRLASVAVGMPVRIGENGSCTVKAIDAATGELTLDLSAEAGIYDAEIVIESLKPLSFVFD